MLKEIIKNILENNKWIDNVKPKWNPPEGTFAEDSDPQKSAKIICDGHKGDLKSSVASVNFFFNRCYDKCKNWREQKRKQIIDILHNICKK